ncbi:DsbA family protein [Usitatibacter palustris]|uniref:Disulfide bond formation protein D n=1 Tax=Usitatibacter palustris TaxID=2732487 RepID=A0A6M4H5K5_9PROT|nr:thioredoxin domain-containing protein [Usitatibacter palustris]QJR14770.1 Disulfide bond formation protein D [Usitatibacter palustris]
MAKRTFALLTPVTAADHAMGPADAPVTVVEYGDFECPYCAQAAPGIHAMIARYAGKLRFVFRHFLHDFHKHALQAAEASEAAASQGAFWKMHDLMYRRQDRLALPDLESYARELRLDMDRFGEEMESHVHVAKIEAQAKDGRQSGVRSTPGLYVNGTRFDVNYDLQSLYDAIDAELSRGKADPRGSAGDRR